MLKEAAILGSLCGLRSTAGPAIAQGILAKSPDALAPHALPKVLLALAAGEFIADKVPSTPARTKPASVAARAAAGAYSAKTLSRLAKEEPLVAALCGAAAAIVATYATYYLRKILSKAVPDPIVGLGEDALVLYAAGYLNRHFN